MATTDDKPAVRCHYEVLGVERDADSASIKKAHRKLALKLHPDKNVGNDDDVHHQFLAVQQAYECLSDAAERKWYDEHREAILQGWTAHGDNDHVDILFDVVPYMHAGCYNGYDDGPGDFYAVYTTVFAEVLKGEMNGEGGSTIDYLEAVVLGNSTSPWDQVAAFYQAWESFSSTLSYAWEDKWDLQQAEHRQVRRAMEDENKKARKAARRERNDDILALVHFVKRRDPRVKARLQQVALEKEQQKHQMKQEATARKKEKKQAMEQWRQDVELQMAAAEEEDRKAGRIRLADLEDDYDYGGKKGKKGKKKNKKKQQQYSSSDDEEEQKVRDDESAENDAAAGGVLAKGDGEQSVNDDNSEEESDSKPEQASPPTEYESSDESLSSSEEEPDSWRCECCRKDFKSKPQMENHLKSKKHKAAWKMYEAKITKQLEEEALGDIMDDLDVDG